MPENISREAARAAGLKYYYVGFCIHEHDSQRLVSNGQCVECKAERSRTPEARDQKAKFERTPKYQRWLAAYHQTPQYHATQARNEQKRQRPSAHHIYKSDHSRQRGTGMPPDMYHYLLIEQAGLCDICDKPMTTVHADHNHNIPGLYRGLLCPGCNRDIAILENPKQLQRAQAYLADHTFIGQRFPVSIPICF